MERVFHRALIAFGNIDLPSSWGSLVVNKATVTRGIGWDCHILTLPD